ncbi:unnamed protein product [Phytophthora lilii]|uniref:Unnamed protein product n=1 Tax=Phytophthora lilii TaxID=2077276 RepID=A0A9W6UDB9_9STRA|nr:unnamed protein product [Phytophthora lilii]
MIAAQTVFLQRLVLGKRTVTGVITPRPGNTTIDLELVFRSTDSTITDEDIDAILAEVAQRTEEMKQNLQVHDKGGMFDFKLDGAGCQYHDGIDYSNEKERQQELKRLLMQNLLAKWLREWESVSGALCFAIVTKKPKVFLARGQDELSDWHKIMKSIEKGESKLLEIEHLTEETARKW